MSRRLLRRLLQACDEAPGTDSDLLAAVFTVELMRLQRAIQRAEADGLVRWHYKRWWITESGRSELASLAATLIANGKEHTPNG